METAENVGSTAPPQVADPGAMARSVAATRASEELKKRGRGRPSNAERAAKAASSPAPAQLDPALAAQIDGMFKPEAWTPLMTLPADAMLALTGNEWWNVGDKEKVSLGATASCAARFLVTQHPRSLALIMVSAAVISVYAPRVIKEAASYRKAKKAAEKKE